MHYNMSKERGPFPEDADPISYYDNFTQTYIDNNQNPADFIDEFLGLLRGKGAERKQILDLGCGHGVNAGYMQSKGFQVTGIDLSEKMVARARKDYPNVEFRVGDMARLSFPADSFDGVLASYSLIHLTKDTIGPCLGKALRDPAARRDCLCLGPVRRIVAGIVYPPFDSKRAIVPQHIFKRRDIRSLV